MVKRKRDPLEGFDPNKSDPEDENFDPEEERATSRSKKSRSSKAKSSRKRSNRYRGSDITDDSDDVFDSEEDASFNESEDEEDEDLPLTSTGRRMRRAALRHASYKESTDDGEEEEGQEEEDVIKDSDDGEPAMEDIPAKPQGRPSKIVVLKTNPRATRAALNRNKEEQPAPTPRPVTRRTRARTEEIEEDFVELSASGRHAQPARASRSRSPEAMVRTTRSTRGGKGLKKVPEPIEEATQETELREEDAEGETNELALTKTGDESEHAGGEDNAAQTEDIPMEDQQEEKAEEENVPAAAEDDDDEDDAPRTRRSTRRATAAAAAATEEAGAETQNSGRGRRLTRGRSRKAQEPSSDFEPVEDSDENDGSEGEAEKNDDEGENESTPTPRGRRTRGRSRRSRRRDSSDDDEIEIDKDELAEELEELRASSTSRRRRTRRRSPSIQYEERITKKRRTKPVDYSIPPIDAVLLAEEEDEDEPPAATPARNRRGGRGASSSVWERALNTTYGPFGGGGGPGALLGGPWGTGATAGVDSDSSDDEMAGRTVGMTPTTTGPAVGLFNPVGADGIAATPQVGRVKNQKMFADADPLGVDMTVDFSKVGGLDNHINQLKEMVQLPLLYPELFQKFHVTPPRGVLFHGPPGTGKTLLARALANSVGAGGRRISFYMRKGADALSKWVGEAEKQLRLLFEEAKRTQPSIIFFDEIDGLAPVRSSKQEQIHASIVSTLLALMDGMDNRGQVIVIGATNRPDNIDPALRRPGRFDREFYFPLPDLEARRAIIDIHTRDWGLSDEFKNALAENTKGYGGADLRALCTEAALNAIQRTYPQIYRSKEKLVVDPDKIQITATDFMISVKRMIPSSERSTASSATPLPKLVEPLLKNQYQAILRVLDNILPRQKKITALEEAEYEPIEDADHGFGREAMAQEFERCRIFRPRLLITGHPGMGQAYLAAAVLHHLEGVHVQTMDLGSLMGDGRPLEQVIVSKFVEVKRHKPGVIFIPEVDVWWNSMTDVAITTFISMLRSIPPSDPILLLATAQCPPAELPIEILRDLFGFSKKNRVVIEKPTRNNRLEFFSNIIDHIRKLPPEFPDPANRKKRVLEDLPVAPPPPPRTLTKEEIRAQRKQDLHHLNLLKMRLQPIMDQINRKYRKFRQPVIPLSQIQYLFEEADPNYVRPDIEDDSSRPYEIATDKEGVPGIREKATGKFFYNLETTTIEERLANGYYARPIDFYKDINRLYLDAKNIGDRDRALKANELRTNVEVDVHDIAISLASMGIKFDEIYERQLQRAREAEERARKKAALQQVVDKVQSEIMGDADADGDSDSQGPVGMGLSMTKMARVANSRRTTTTAATAARFQPIMSPESKRHQDGADSHRLTNGTSSTSRQDGEDVHMSGVDDETQPLSFPRAEMSSPVQWPHFGPRTHLESSMRATQGTHLSQRSAITTVPPGVAPSAIANEASTTKTSELSSHRTSTGWGTQNTNGTAHGPEENSLIDTQEQGVHFQQASQPLLPSGSQSSTSGSWAHSQAAAIAAGLLPARLGVMPPPPGRGSSDNTPSSSQQNVPGKPSVTSLGNILNPEEHPGNGSGSGVGPSQPSNNARASHNNNQSGPSSGSSAGSFATPHTPRSGGGAPSAGIPANLVGALRASGRSIVSSQQAVIHEGLLEEFRQTLAERTVGCSVEQLEQIYRELMDVIWHTRHEWNRMAVLSTLTSVFNDTIEDIQLVQGELVGSEKKKEHEHRTAALMAAAAKAAEEAGQGLAQLMEKMQAQGQVQQSDGSQADVVLESVEGLGGVAAVAPATAASAGASEQGRVQGKGQSSQRQSSQGQSQEQSQGRSRGKDDEPWVYLRGDMVA